MIPIFLFFPFQILLLQYLYCYLKKSAMEDSEIAAYALYCIENLNSINATNRKMPPSTLEVNVSVLVNLFFVLGQETGFTYVNSCLILSRTVKPNLT